MFPKKINFIFVVYLVFDNDFILSWKIYVYLLFEEMLSNNFSKVNVACCIKDLYDRNWLLTKMQNLIAAIKRKRNWNISLISISFHLIY